jgi:hypothetical protein
MLNRTAKLQWGLGHKSLETVYEGAIVSLMTYGAPIWEGAIIKRKYLQKLQTAQRLINIKIAKAYRTISFEASCVMANVNRKLGLENSDIVCDMPLPINKWPHPAQLVTITETSELTTYPIEIHTDGSKVGAEDAIYSNKQLVKQCKYKLHSNCSNNQAEQIAILKALEQLQGLEAPTGRKVAIYTDSRVAIDSLKTLPCMVS